jgi:hypothetical protein
MKLSLAIALGIVLLTSAAPLKASVFAEARSGDYEIGLEALRKSVQRDFLGFGQFDDASELALDDRLAEVVVTQACRAIPEVLAAAREAFPGVSLNEFAVSRQFPRNAVYFRRSSDEEKRKDVVNFYFTVEKRTGVDCTFTFGAFARTIIEKSSNTAARKTAVFDKLVADVGAAIKQIEALLTAPRTGALFDASDPPATEAQKSAIELLRSRTHTDRILDAAVKRAVAALRSEFADYQVKRDDFEVLVVMFGTDVPSAIERYKTPNCIAVPRELPKPTIICNADYLSEVEAVIRFFENAELGIRTTEAFRRLVKDFSKDGTAMLAKLRANKTIQSLSGQNDEHVTDHMSMAVLFLLAHEVGHLLSSTGNGELDESGLAAASSYRAAILRLCLHADQFRRANFELDFTDALIDPSSAERSFLARFRAQDKLIEATEEKFREELLADLFATDLSLRYFARLSKGDRNAAEMKQYLFLENLEALATYFWYRGYFLFTDVTCGGVLSSVELSECLGWKPENFVAAADVFGKFHPNIFLRAYDTFGSFLGERTTFYDIPLEQRAISIDPDDPAFVALGDKERDKALKVMFVLQRYFLLRELVDTPLKFAYTGCMLGWAKEVRGGTVPLVFMRFFSYEEELQRFVRKLSK